MSRNPLRTNNPDAWLQCLLTPGARIHDRMDARRNSPKNVGVGISLLAGRRPSSSHSSLLVGLLCMQASYLLYSSIPKHSHRVGWCPSYSASVSYWRRLRLAWSFGLFRKNFSVHEDEWAAVACRVGIDVEKSASHQQSQNAIGSDNPCSRHLSVLNPEFPLTALVRKLIRA
jgi:hypothetical protein